tara:strand:- start:170 stop:400 length:231 start_codon:yes stop_codon:yes gene_type:complete
MAALITNIAETLVATTLIQTKRRRREELLRNIMSRKGHLPPNIQVVILLILKLKIVNIKLLTVILKITFRVVSQEE